MTERTIDDIDNNAERTYDEYDDIPIGCDEIITFGAPPDIDPDDYFLTE